MNVELKTREMGSDIDPDTGNFRQAEPETKPPKMTRDTVDRIGRYYDSRFRPNPKGNPSFEYYFAAIDKLGLFDKNAITDAQLEQAAQIAEADFEQSRAQRDAFKDAVAESLKAGQEVKKLEEEAREERRKRVRLSNEQARQNISRN